MKSNYIHVCLVVDCSGSMMGSEKDVVGGIMNVINEQKKNKNGTCSVSLYEFASTVEEKFIGKDVNEINDYKYDLRGCTALYDGIGTAIDNIGKWLADTPEDERPEKNLIVIMTDGLENASKKYKCSQIKEMIKHQEDKYNWTFMYLGSDLSDSRDADSLGITLKAATTKSDLGAAYATINAVTSTYRDTVGDVSAKMFAFSKAADTCATTLNAAYAAKTGIDFDNSQAATQTKHKKK